MKSLIIYLLSVVFVGCELVVEDESAPINSQMSVSCVISPQDTLLIAYVFGVQSIGSSSFHRNAEVNDAMVLISDGFTADTLKFNLERGRYESAPNYVKIETSKEYHLLIEAPEKTALEATCLIPPSLDSLNINGRYLEDDYSFTLSWHNPEANPYYVVTLYSNAYAFFDNFRYQLNPALLDEIEFPSEDHQVRNTLPGIVQAAALSDSASMEVIVMNVDRNFYDFIETYERYSSWQSNNSGSLLPNFQEMPLIFSNVENGKGIFSGHNRATAVFSF
jgi:hypothetical protein